MSNYPQYPQHPQPQYPQYGAEPQAYESSGVVGRFVNMVYAWMCVGLAVTALVAWVVAARADVMRSIFQPGTFIVLFLVELGLVWVIGSAIKSLSAGMATFLFVLYSALNGLTLSVIFVAYSLGTIGAAFGVTAGMFGIMCLYGFVTKRDLTKLGSFLLMALIGLILASVVNVVFLPHSSGLYWLTTYAGILIFLGLTAYDAQKLKVWAYQTEGDPALAQRVAVIGALELYLDFINLFLLLLRVLGKARD